MIYTFEKSIDNVVSLYDQISNHSDLKSKLGNIIHEDGVIYVKMKSPLTGPLVTSLTTIVENYTDPDIVIVDSSDLTSDGTVTFTSHSLRDWDWVSTDNRSTQQDMCYVMPHDGIITHVTGFLSDVQYGWQGRVDVGVYVETSVFDTIRFGDSTTFQTPHDRNVGNDWYNQSRVSPKLSIPFRAGDRIRMRVFGVNGRINHFSSNVWVKWS